MRKLIVLGIGYTAGLLVGYRLGQKHAAEAIAAFMVRNGLAASEDCGDPDCPVHGGAERDEHVFH